jgi:hypothetical protein
LSWITKIKHELMAYEAMFATTYWTIILDTLFGMLDPKLSEV